MPGHVYVCVCIYAHVKIEHFIDATVYDDLLLFDTIKVMIKLWPIMLLILSISYAILQ